jgi:hypothetical protein
VGGSGGRLVARMLAELDFYLGEDLDGGYDNFWFALLLNHSSWHAKQAPEGIRARLRVFDKAMTGSGRLTPSDVALILASAYHAAFVGRRRPDGPRFGLRWSHRRARSLLRAPRRAARHPRWGWKAPSTHIHLPQVASHFDGVSYIHVLRHGLDIAFGHNQSQLHNWGPLLGVAVPESRSLLPRASLRYWVEANRRAAELGAKLLGGRFLLLNYELLCDRPKATIDELLRFLGLSITDETRSRLVRLPESPASRGRYLGRDLGVFEPRDLAAVREFGFQV